MATRQRRPATAANHAPDRPLASADGAAARPRDVAAEATAPPETNGRRPSRRRDRGPVAELLQRAVEEAARLLEADGAIIYLLDESTGIMRFAFEAGISDLRGRRWVRRLQLPLGRGMFGVAAQERRVVQTPDYPNDTSFRHSPDADRFVREVGLRSMITAPLVAGDRVFGAIGTYSRRPNAFGEAQQGLVRALADHAAQAMANALLIEELARSRAEQVLRAERERTLREIATRISALHDPAEVIQETVDEAARLLDAEGARIDLLDPQKGLLRWAYQSGATRPSDEIWPEDPEEELDQGVSGKAVVEGRVFFTGDYLADDRFIHRPGPDSYIASVGILSVMAAPLIGDRGAFGALTIYTTRRDAWTAEDAELLEALATEAAIALRNARMIEELGRSRSAVARRAEAEQALREIAARITAVRDPAELLQLVIGSATRLVRADGGILDLLDPKMNVLRWSFDTGIRHLFDPAEIDELWIPVGIGATGIAVAEDRVVIENANPRDQFPPSAVNDAFFDRTGFQSMIIAPISSEEGPLGAIEVYSKRQNGFDDSDAALIGSLADQAAIAIQNARLIEQLAHSREEIARRADAERTLREIAARITAIRDPDEILHQVLDASTRLLGASGAMINLVGATGTDPSWAWAQEGSPANFHILDDVSLEPESGVSGLAISTGRVEISDDYLDDARFHHSPERDEFVRDAGIRSVIAAPVMVGDTPTGTITVYSPEPAAFDEKDAELMKALADQAAVTITNAQLIDQLERTREEVQRRADAERSLREIAANISAIREPDVVLQQTINEATRLLRADGGIIDLLDQDSGSLRWAYDTGMFREFDRERFGAAETQLGKGIAGRAVLERRVIRTGDYQSHEFVHVDEADQLAAEMAIRSVIVAPILGESGPVGAIEIYARRSDAFDDLDATVLAGLAEQAAIAIQNARLIEALDRSGEEIRRRADAERALRQIAANITSIRDADVILQQAVDEARRLLDSSDARIDLLENGRLRWAFTSESSQLANLREMDATFGVGEGVAGLAVQERRPFRTGDYLADTRFPHTPSSDRFVEASGFHSALAVPLIGEGGPLGAISVATQRQDAYDDGDAELLQALADQATIAIQNAQLIGELERSRTSLAQAADAERSLREMAARIAELRDPDELLRRIVDESRRLLGSDGAHLTRMRDDGQALVPVVVAGELDAGTQAWLLELEFPLMGGINGLAAGLGQPVWTEDYLADPRIPQEPEDHEVADRLGLRGMAAVPLRSPEGGTIGTLAVSFREPHGFDDDQLALLKGLADHAAIALTNTSLYERLRESELAYRHLVQNSPDLIWSIDADAKLTFVSDTCERLTGWKPDELLGRHFGALVHESSREVAEIDWTKGMALPQQELRGRLNLLHRDGHAIPAEFTAMGTLDDDGRFVGANGSVRDMTERDRLERELRESEERYRFLVEKSPDIIWSTTVDGRVTYMSTSVQRVLGYSPEELVGRQYGELLPPGRWDAQMAHWEALLREPEREQVMRFEMRHRDGRLIPFEISVVGRTEKGRLAALQGVSREITVRERLERELRESEARFRQLVQTTPDTIWRADADGRFLFMADSAESLFGWPAREVVGEHFGVFTAAESMPIAQAEYAAMAVDPDVVRHVSLTLVRKDGSRFAGEVTMIGIVEDGRFAGGQGTVRDVSERERLEHELRESEERYRFLVENSPDIVFSTDARGSLTYVSETIERALGYRPEDLIGRPFAEISVGEPGLPRGIRWAQMAEDPTREMVFRYVMVHRDGRQIPFEVSARGLVRDGRFSGVYGAARDVSDRERLERELRKSENRYRFLVQNSPDVIFSTDAEGRFTYVSETLEQLTGFRPDAVVGQHFATLVDPPSLPIAAQRFQALTDDPGTPQIVQLNLRRADGSIVPTEVSSTGQVDEEGRFAGITGSTRDLTDRLGLERDLRRQAAELAAGEERAHLARELHDSVTQALFSMTLLTRTIEMLLDRDMGQARDQLGALRELQREALAEMRALIFELRPGNLEQDGLYKALRTHTAALQGRIGLPVVVKAEFEDRLPIAVEEVLYRIAQEALHNVVKHAGAREVRLELVRDGLDVRLRILDDGKGFDPGSVPDGHLGLAGMRARADKIGGRLEVTSRPGTGTTIEVVVPGAAIEAARRSGPVATDLREMGVGSSAE